MFDTAIRIESSRRIPRSLAFPLVIGLTVLSGASASAGTVSLTGNIVVLRVGDGSAALTSASTASFLDDFTPAGALVATFPMPTTASGANMPFTNAGSSTSEGFLNLSSDGQYIVCGGYGVAPGTTAIAGTTSATIPRVVARIDLNGSIDTSTALSDAYSAGNIRSATSDNGMQFWTGGSVGGTRYAALAATTSTLISMGAPTNQRVIGIFAGQLYVSSGSTPFLGVSTVGTGLPTTSGQTVTLLSGFPITAGPSSYDYFFADANTLYVADDRAAVSGGGIQKWTQSAGTWTLQYTIAPGTIGCRGLTGVTLGASTILYATTALSSANQLVRTTDVGLASVFTTLATAPTNTAFRGVRIAPVVCTGGADCNGNSISDACDIAFGLSADVNHNAIPDSCEQNGGTPYCFGYSGCPCMNNSSPGSGQGCTHGAGGAALLGSGTPSVSADSLVLTVTNLPPPPGGVGSALFFQGDAATNVPFNDGLRCVGGNQVRLGVKSHTGTTASYPGPGDPSISVRGGIAAGGGGYNYQVWYRTFPSVCGQHSNLSNGVSVPWQM